MILQPGAYALVPSTYVSPESLPTPKIETTKNPNAREREERFEKSKRLAPGKCAAQFVLEVRADLPLNFAQGGDTMADLEADDEEPGDLPADAELAQKVSTLHPPAQPLHEPAGKELESLWGQLSNLQRLLADLDASNNAIDAKLALLEDATPPVEDAAQC